MLPGGAVPESGPALVGALARGEAGSVQVGAARKGFLLVTILRCLKILSMHHSRKGYGGRTFG